MRLSLNISFSSVLAPPLCLVVLFFSACVKRPGTINGTLYAECSFYAGDDVAIGSKNVEMAGIKLVAQSDGFTSAPCLTDLFGRFNFNDLPGGKYTLRWEEQNGWAAGKHSQIFKVDGQVAHARPVMIKPEVGPAMCGHSGLVDGSSQYFADEYFGVVSTAQVSVADAVGANILMEPAPVNAMGYFVVPNRPKVRTHMLILHNEALTTDRSFATLAVNAGGPVEMEQKNHKPLLLELTPTLNGSTVRTAPGGSVLQVVATAKDGDGHGLSFRWATAPGSGDVVASGNTGQWTLPPGAGRYTLYVLVNDGHGGYDRQTIEFEAEKKTDEFSGRLLDKFTGNPIADADVTVAGKAAKTDAQGYFRIVAPFQDRFILGATKRAYAPLSKVVYSGLVGRTWRMVPAQETTVDPSQGFVIEDKRPVLEKERRRGARVSVPANGLVDKDGKKPTGSLSAFIATINIGAGESPGDWGAIASNGSETSLLSFGAAWVEFLDAAGNKFNLAPGKQAEVEMPAPDNMIAAAPPSVKFWSYDEGDGYWRTTGTASLKPSKKSFIGRVPHFSYVNADLEKNDPACLRILLYPGIALGQTIRISFPPGSPYSQTYDIEDCDAPLNAAYRLPANTDVVLSFIKSDGTVDAEVGIQENAGLFLEDNVVNTGPPQGTADWRVPEPYEACKLVIMAYPKEVEEQPSLFLTVNQQYLDDDPVKPVNGAAATEAYYRAIDPNNERLTLGAWWAKNGFAFDPNDANGPPTNATRTSYTNHNDLGSGRDMYFHKVDDQHIAAYVTNYGRFDQNPENARFAQDRVFEQLTATVCMEYSPVEGATDQDPIVKFFVYFTGNQPQHADHVRIPSADLDYFGQKFVPNLCVNCHGAEYYSPANPLLPTFDDVDVSASFRELDYNTYRFLNGGTDPLTQRANFKLQNEIVATNGRISTQAIKDVIAGWYADGDDIQQTDWAPSSYGTPGSASHDLYTGVVARSCRTCHLALSENISWANYDDFKIYGPGLEDLVLCGSDRRMPHAAITYRNFWTSTNPHGPGLLRGYSDTDPETNWDPIGPCSVP